MADRSPFRGGCAVLDLSSLDAVLEVSGGDGFDYLQRQISADLHKLTDSRGARSTLMTRKGKMLAAFEIHRLESGFLICGESGAMATLHQQLAKFVILEDVTLRESEAFGCVLSLQGPNAGAVLEELSLNVPAAEEQLEASLHEFGGHPARVVRRARCEAGGFDIIIPESVKQEFMKAAGVAGAVAVDEAMAEAARIDAGIPRFGIDASDLHLPPEAGYDDALSYDKGCYVGQEIVARIRTYGHVNKCLCRLRLETATVLEVESPVWHDGKKTGHVTSAALSPRDGRGVALAYLRLAAAEPDTTVSVGDPLEPAQVEPIHTPS